MRKRCFALPQRYKGLEVAAAADLRHLRAITHSHLDKDHSSQRPHSHSHSLSAFYLHLLPTLQINHVTNHMYKHRLSPTGMSYTRRKAAHIIAQVNPPSRAPPFPSSGRHSKEHFNFDSSEICISKALVESIFPPRMKARKKTASVLLSLTEH